MTPPATEKMLNDLSAVKTHFQTNTTPYYFISPTNFNLMGIEKWVKNLKHVNFIDSYDGKNSQVVVPKNLSTAVFESLEDINQYLLSHKEIVDLIEDETQSLASNAVFLFLNKDIEEICTDLNLVVNLPPVELIKEIDNKIVTTRMGNEAAVPSVPNIIAKIGSYDSLCRAQKENDLGTSVVVQTAYGDSGKTTFFIQNREDYEKVASQIEEESEVKIMKKINCISTAIEGCVTQSGTFVGPLFTELIGESSLTPYRGGWCGNEWDPAKLTLAIRKQAQEMTVRLGSALYKRGYKGYFEVDYLLDLDSGNLYLGELNPRITGITAVTNFAQTIHDQLPLFLFHLLEFSKLSFDLDPKPYNDAALNVKSTTPVSQLIFKYTEEALKIIIKAPVSGVYRRDEAGQLSLVKATADRNEARDPNEVYFLRIMDAGEYLYKAADLGILFLNQAIKTKDDQMTADAQIWIDAVWSQFEYRDLTDEERTMIDRFKSPAKIKGF